MKFDFCVPMLEYQRAAGDCSAYYIDPVKQRFHVSVIVELSAKTVSSHSGCPEYVDQAYNVFNNSIRLFARQCC